MEFQIKDFITTERKVELIGLSIQEASTEGIINPMVLDIVFNVNLFLVYTNNNISAEEKFNKFTLFDKLIENNTLDNFKTQLEKVFPKEKEYLEESLDKWVQEEKVYRNSFNGILDNLKLFANDIADKMGGSLEKLDGIDLNQLEQLAPLAKELGINLKKE